MSDWPPEGWYRDKSQRASSGEGNSPITGASDPTVRLPAGGRAPGGDPAWGAQPAQLPPSSPWPEQPPPQSGRPGRGSGRSGWRRPGRWIKLVAGVIAAILLVSVGLYFYLNSKLTRSSILVDYPNRPAASAGTNWLIAGSDSRQGLSRADERKYSTGRDVSGSRSDTIMLLHVSSNGTPSVLVSIPRDSYVAIPGYGSNKINAAFSFGGPKLLAQTVQNATGLRIDHFMDIGFGGFVNVVNDVGGVNMCLPGPLKDQASGLNLKKGCHTLSGGEALSYVRDRHNFANQDLQRIQDQRLFVKSLLSKMTSPGTFLNPFAAIPAAFGTASTLTVDQGTQLYQLIEVAFALRNPETTTVPIANANYLTANAGDAVLWDHTQASRLFRDLGADRAVPRSLLSGSKLSRQGG